MDPFRLCLALGPLAIYLLLLGSINFWRRPFITTGARDVAALGIGISGLVLVGPIELLTPDTLPPPFDELLWVFWLTIATLYFLVFSLIVLSVRPRISIYNVASDELRAVLARVAPVLDPQARWAGSSLVLPGLGVELFLDDFVVLRHVSLVPLGTSQSYRGWRQLERALSAALRGQRSSISPAAFSFLLLGSMMLAAILVSWSRNPQAVAKAFREMLGL